MNFVTLIDKVSHQPPCTLLGSSWSTVEIVCTCLQQPLDLEAKSSSPPKLLVTNVTSSCSIINNKIARPLLWSQFYFESQPAGPLNRDVHLHSPVFGKVGSGGFQEEQILWRYRPPKEDCDTQCILFSHAPIRILIAHASRYQRRPAITWARDLASNHIQGSKGLHWRRLVQFSSS
jgi:hypothetical protein